MFGLPAMVRVRPLNRFGLVATAVAVAVMVPSTVASAATGPALLCSATPDGTSEGAAAVAAVHSASAAKPHGAKKAKKKVPAYRQPKRILKTARKYDGSYYRYAGTTPSGFDCSGYTRYVFGKLGRSLPHNAAAQYTRVKHISRKHARKGDLIFFRSSSGHIYHVGIFAGHHRLYHASEPGRRTGLGVIFSGRVSFGRA